MSAFLLFTVLLFIPLSSGLPTLISGPVNASSNPIKNDYIVDYCSGDQSTGVERATDLARIDALSAIHDATILKLYGFEPFFKGMDYPVTTVLEEIGEWKPLSLLTPRFACVTQEASDHFSEIRPSIMEICQSSPNWESIFINGHNHIFICPRIWTYPEEPLLSDHNSCPEVGDNMFTKGIPKYKSNVILEALVRWRLQHVNLPLSEPNRLNEMVALNAMNSYLSPKNYSAYISMVRNQCTKFPNIHRYPWVHPLSTNRTGMMPTNTSSSMVPFATDALSFDSTS